MVSNPVYINGFQVGSVFDIENSDKALSSILVTIKLKDYFFIPVNSVAMIKENVLGTPSIDIKLGNSAKGIMTGDTIQTADDPGMISQVMNKVGPFGDQLRATIKSLDLV